jgi:hypothetical protein
MEIRPQPPQQPPPGAAPSPLLIALAVLSAGAAVIHAGVSGDHFAEDWAHGIFFVAVAWAQLGWAALVLWRPARPVLLAGAAGNLAVALVWVVSRTTGLPFGAGAGQPEPVGFADLVCTGFELALVAGALLMLASGRGGRAAGVLATARQGPGLRRVAAAGVTVVVVGLASVSFVPALADTGGHATGSGHQHGATTARGQGGTHAHVHGQVDVGSQAPPTPAQRAAAAKLLAGTRSAVRRWPTIKAAEADGFRPINVTKGLVHLGRIDWIADRRVLDPTHPESLVYYQAPDGRSLLLGAMYIMPPGQDGPQIGGSLTRWHVHTNLCLNPVTDLTTPVRADGSCQPGSAKPSSPPQMLHVWTVDYPGGPFADIDAASVRTAVLQAIATQGLH